MDALDLRVIWFVLLGAIVIGYAVLDGFDLGVGILHLALRGDEERRLAINAIGPVWDGNEVWLVVGGGAAFAAFPEVYATVFSGFYTAFMLLLLALIFRAVAIEFRSKRPSAAWRRAWDLAFAGGSAGAALLVGLAFGNLAAGVPLDPDHNLRIGLVGMLRPYPILVGITAMALFALHGCLYLDLKLEGAPQARVRRWVQPLMIGFILCYAFTTVATLLYQPHLAERFRDQPAWFVVPALTILAVANIPRELHRGHEFRAFLSSGAAIGLLMTLVAIGLFPAIVYSDPNPERSLTIYNSASSNATLRTMLVVAVVGLPLVIAYTAMIYWIFRGKVRLDPHSY
jgi:cytochrome bd ubiquinol oxidase subunit II